jgi:hypothetical protein
MGQLSDNLASLLADIGAADKPEVTYAFNSGVAALAIAIAHGPATRDELNEEILALLDNPWGHSRA